MKWIFLVIVLTISLETVSAQVTTEKIADSFVRQWGVFHVNYKTSDSVRVFRMTYSESATEVSYMYMAVDTVKQKKGYFLITVDKSKMAISSVKVQKKENAVM